MGTLGYKLTSDSEYFEAKHTTPQAPELQATLERILKLDITNVVTEVSSHALEQHRVDDCIFKGAVFTNLTQDHLDFHITMENYFLAKMKLFERLEKMPLLLSIMMINMQKDLQTPYPKVLSF
jgi:UDP-N-acetylmuramoyl-L-alanyl-D-glutamate--2,6-diaminopimelate ligase